MKKVSNRKKVLLICNGGGHLEQMRQIMKISKKYDCILVTMKDNSTKKMDCNKRFVKDYYRGKSKILRFFNLLFIFIQQFFVYLRIRPDVVITTGAGCAIPMCLIAHFFKKKTIYIESFARMESSNKSGRFLYKYVDLFVVQWESLLSIYPNAEFWGGIY